MGSTLKQRGEVLTWLNDTGDPVAVDDVVVIGHFLGVALENIAADAEGPVHLGEVHELPAVAAEEWEVGDKIFFDEDEEEFTLEADDNKPAGAAWAAKAADDEVGLVRLIPNTQVVDAIGLAELSDVAGVITGDAGKVLIGDGAAALAEQALTGPLTLSAAGIVGVKCATVAADGNDQATAEPIAEGFTLATTNSAAKGVKLPTAAAGKVCIVKNAAAATALNVYPFLGDEINALTANVVLIMAAAKAAVFVAYDDTTWYTIPLLPS